jgi:hypothetical protein
MSRNNKSAKLHAQARKLTEQRKNGGKGPAKTTAVHGKKNAWWQKFPSYSAWVNGAKKHKPAEAEAA